MFGDIPVFDPSSADIHHHEDVEHAERGGDRDEEIARQYRAGVVAAQTCSIAATVRSGDAMPVGIQRLTVRGDTRIPSFSSNSEAIRSSPHVRFAIAISANELSEVGRDA